MTLWELLCAGRALRNRVHRGPGPPTAAAAGFCLSAERAALASYLQQIQCLEAANQRLEHQLQEELDRKCTKDLKELDGHLRTVSLLQDQISGCLSAQAQVKLRLLAAELTIFDFHTKCEKEREVRHRLEAELTNLRQREAELKVHRLPELQSQFSDRTQRLIELQIWHQQDRQGLLAQVWGGVAIGMQRSESSDLIQQLDRLRQISLTGLNKNQNNRKSKAQVPGLSSSLVTFDPAEAELVDLRRTVVSLEEELTGLQILNVLLEESAQNQDEFFVLQLNVLQQRADSLCVDVDTVVQAAAELAEGLHILLDVTFRLETEIQDYQRLLDGPSPERVFSHLLNSKPALMSLCSPERGVRVQIAGVHRWTNPVNQPIRVHSEDGENSTTTSIITPTDKFHNSENMRTRSLLEQIERNSIRVDQTSLGSDKEADGSVQQEKPDPAQSVKMEPAGGETSCWRSEKVQDEVCSPVILMNQKDRDREVKEDPDSEATPPSGSVVRNQNHWRDADMVVIEVKLSLMDNLNLEDQKASLETKESKIPTSLADSGLALSSLDTEDLSPIKTDVFLSPTKTSLSPESGPLETKFFLTLTNQVFCPVDPEDHIKSPDSLLCSNDPEIYFEPNESETSLSPYEKDEDEDACLSLTEAASPVRPVEKYFLSTKDKGPSTSLRQQSLPEDIVSKSDEEHLLFGSFNCEEGRGVIPTVPQLNSSIGGSESEGFGIIAVKEEKFGFSSLKSPKDWNKDDNKEVQSSGSGWSSSEDQRQSKDHASTSGGTAPESSGMLRHDAAKGQGAVGPGRQLRVYGGSLGHRRTSTSRTGMEENPSGTTYSVGRFGSGEWLVYGGSLRRKSSLDAAGTPPSGGNKGSPADTGRTRNCLGSGGSLEYMSRGDSGVKTKCEDSPLEAGPGAGSVDRMIRSAGPRWMSSLIGGRSSGADTERSLSVNTQPEKGSSSSRRSQTGRFGSGEWRVYGGSPGRLSRASSTDTVAANDVQVISPPRIRTGSGPSFSSTGSGEWLTSSAVVRRSKSTGSGGRLCSSSGSDRISSSEWKPVYSPTVGRRSSGGRSGQPGGPGSNDRISNRAEGRMSRSSGSGWTKSTGGRVISSSNRPIRSSGSGAGRNKERISVCKMAALSISAAGREKSQERQKLNQRSHQHQQQAAVTCPLVHHWLAAAVMSDEGLDDITHV